MPDVSHINELVGRKQQLLDRIPDGSAEAAALKQAVGKSLDAMRAGNYQEARDQIMTIRRIASTQNLVPVPTNGEPPLTKPNPWLECGDDCVKASDEVVSYSICYWGCILRETTFLFSSSVSQQSSLVPDPEKPDPDRPGDEDIEDVPPDFTPEQVSEAVGTEKIDQPHPRPTQDD
jgi:hypothetical protein